MVNCNTATFVWNWLAIYQPFHSYIFFCYLLNSFSFFFFFSWVDVLRYKYMFITNFFPFLHIRFYSKYTQNSNCKHNKNIEIKKKIHCKWEILYEWDTYTHLKMWNERNNNEEKKKTTKHKIVVCWRLTLISLLSISDMPVPQLKKQT